VRQDGYQELLMDTRTAARAARLRRIAAVEIARHREKNGFLGAALDGSLATGAVWPTSDLDFTVVPPAAAENEIGVEWGQREGIIWHKHLTGRQVLFDLVKGYPESFVRSADREFNLDANWLLDGLAVMEVVEDPEGLLAETKAFVAARRFAPPVWEGRREALLKELRRQQDAARAAMDRGEPEEACEGISRPTGLAVVAAQLWLEAAHRIYSSKEQDGLLAEVMRAAGHPKAHALYHAAMGVQPDRAKAAAPLVLELGKCGAAFFRRFAAVPRRFRQRHGRLPTWIAWVRYLAATLALAPRKGHPAAVYQRRGTLRYWTATAPGTIVKELQEKEAPGLKELETLAAAAVRLNEALRETLLGPATASDRAQTALAAAERLVAVTAQAM
jgi:hypothetical protein